MDKQDNGAHKDMDYALMCKSIKTLHPYFTRLTEKGFQKDLPLVKEIQSIGLEAEKAMLESTNGVNTHKGALFAMGLLLVSSANLLYNGVLTEENLRNTISSLAKQFPAPQNTHGSEVLKENKIVGALDNAILAYPDLFESWLPYYRNIKADSYSLHKTLLFIMTSLEDSNVYYRRGKQMAQTVKQQAKALLESFSSFALEKMNRDFVKENVSPGGAADMLSLTLFVASILSEK